MASRFSSSRGALAWALAVAISTHAWAEPPNPPSQAPAPENGGAPDPQASPDPARARADELIAEGVELRKQGQEREALTRFQDALKLAPSARAHAQIALAMKSLRLYVGAERHLREALAASDDAWIDTHRATLEQALDFVDRQLGWLSVTTQLDAVEVTLNGEVVGSVSRGAKLRVPAGELGVELRASGFAPKRLRLASNAQRVTDLTATLEREQPPDPGARPTTAAPPDAPRAPQSDSKPLPALAYVTASVAVAGLALGSYFGLRALSLRKDRDELCPETRCSSDEGVALDEDGRTAATWSTVSFAAGAAGLLATGYLVFFRSEPASKQPRAVPRPKLGVALSRERAILVYGARF
jgi:hypothetical protein